nr:hypothetical protein BgiMline_003363 [Biomphalaria glabrata]
MFSVVFRSHLSTLTPHQSTFNETKTSERWSPEEHDTVNGEDLREVCGESREFWGFERSLWRVKGVLGILEKSVASQGSFGDFREVCGESREFWGF